MDSANLDRLWDEWMESLSESYARTLTLLEEGEKTAAATEFADDFVQTVKKLYTESASTYPGRFSKIKETGDWGEWTRNLYTTSMRAQKDFTQQRFDEARSQLQAIREQFGDLHAKTDTRKGNDWIHAYWRELAKDTPDPKALSDLAGKVEAAEPSRKSAKAPEVYSAALADWKAKSSSLLSSKSLSPDNLKTLRAAATPLYKDYGIPFE